MSYITEQIIAMGYPSEGFEGTYRNSINDVKTFFTEKHQARYKIYNLCSERKYDVGYFRQNSVNEDFGFDDHNPPPFDIIFEFCKDCFKFLDENPKNVAAIHCKAGKGRTGVIICCYLVFAGHQTISDGKVEEGKFLIKDAKDAMIYYGKIRTKDGKGVTIPSQIRYVYYFDHFLKLLTYAKKQLQQNKGPPNIVNPHKQKEKEKEKDSYT